MEMRIDQLGQDVVAVTVEGRLDATGSAAIQPGLSALAASNRCLLVNLAAVTFLSSIGIRTLLAGARAVLGRGGRFFLINPADEVEKVLAVSGVADPMPIVRTNDEALAEIASTG